MIISMGHKAFLTHCIALLIGSGATWLAVRSSLPKRSPSNVLPELSAPYITSNTESNLYSSIKSMDVRSGAEAVKLNFRFRTEHQTLLSILSDKCRGNNSIRTRVTACQMMGELGGNTPNQALLNSILLRSPETVIRLNADSLELHQEEYPAVFALIRLGDDAIPKVIYELRTTDEDDRRQLFVSVLRSIDGLYIARYRLQRLLAYEFDLRRQQRIKRAINLLPKVKYYAPQLLDHPLDDPLDSGFSSYP